jgi:hypothetical protein
VHGEVQLDVQDWARGTYVLQIITDAGVANEAIVLQ